VLVSSGVSSRPRRRIHRPTLARLVSMVKGTDTSGSRGGSGRVFRLPEGRPRVPLMYSLRASKI